MAWKMGLSSGHAEAGAAGHDGRAFERAFFAAGNAHAHEAEALGVQILGAADGIGEVAVAAVDEDVVLFQERDQLIDEIVHGGAGLDHHHDFAGLFEGVHQFLEGMGADELLAFAASIDQFVHLGRGPVEHRDGITAAFHVKDQVFTHHRKADQADIRLCHSIQSSCMRKDPGSVPRRQAPSQKRPMIAPARGATRI